MNLLIRIGEGSSKKLESNTHWYVYDEKDDAIKDALNTGHHIYVSKNKQKYKQITLGELIDL